MKNISERKGIVIISGGGSGLGKELARQVMNLNKNVMILGRDIEKLNQTAEEFSHMADGTDLIAFKCDISNQNDIDNLASMIDNSGYYVEYLFNNAGKGFFRGVSENRSPVVEEVIGSNFSGLILLTSAIIGLSSLSRTVTIVNIMSTSALLGRGGQTLYCAAKWGARGFTEALRDELKGTGHKVVAVYPGGMKTPFYDGDPRDITSFMDPADVAAQIAQAVFDTKGVFVSDITIQRP